MAVETSATQPGSAAPARRRIAANTAIFSIATGLSRIAGLIREIVASSYFATSGAFSAFTIAFQVPNLVRSLFADAALSAAFVPVFTELLEKDRKQDAFRLASTLFFCILLILGALTAFFILAAGFVMPLFLGAKFSAELTALTVGLSRVLFPIVVLLGINGLLVGILNAYDHFSIPAISPLVWNFVIIVTLVQLLMILPVFGRIDFRLTVHFNPRDPRVRRVFALMIPVTIGLGVINFDLLINSSLGSLVSDQAPRAIDAAFRIYMLPQGMFSVALATVLFPALSRFAARGDIDGLRETMATGIRQIALLLLPSAAFTLALATPIVRLIYQHGSFGPSSTDKVALALFWFSFSLPFSGFNLLLTRTFFSLQRPWIPTALASASLVVNAIVSLALYRPYGIAGLVIGTAVASAGMAIGQAYYLREQMAGRLDLRRTLLAVFAIVCAAALMAIVSYAVWAVADQVFGRSTVGQILAVSLAGAAGAGAYIASVLWMEVPEAHAIRALIAGRLGRRSPAA